MDINAALRRLTTALGATGIMLGSLSCGDVTQQGRSPSILIIDSLEAASGATPAQFGGFLHSDVQTNGGILNDLGQVTLRVMLKDPGNPGAPSGPSTLNAVTVNRYRIEYRRADGRNQPGVDVPYPIDGALTATITAQPSDVGFEIVRHQAKIDPPLLALRGQGGRVLIATLTDITFYGRDQVGNEVKATGTISVNFGDFADPE